MFSITSGRTIVGSVTVFRPVSRSKAWRSRRLLLDDNNTPGLDDILRLLDVIPALKSGFLILSRFACYVRWLYHRLFPSQSPYAQ